MGIKTRLKAGLISLAITLFSAELVGLMMHGSQGSTFV